MNISSIAATGLSSAFDRIDKAAEAIAGVTDPGNPADTIDISTAAIELSAAKLEAAANVRVIRAEQELVKNTLDLLA